MDTKIKNNGPLPLSDAYDCQDFFPGGKYSKFLSEHIGNADLCVYVSSKYYPKMFEFIHDMEIKNEFEQRGRINVDGIYISNIISLCGEFNVLGIYYNRKNIFNGFILLKTDIDKIVEENQLYLNLGRIKL